MKVQLTFIYYLWPVITAKYHILSYDNCHVTNNIVTIIIRYPATIYLFKVNSRNTRKRCKICLKLTIKTTERRHKRRSSVFIVNLEQISHIFWCFYCWIGTSKVFWKILDEKKHATEMQGGGKQFVYTL